VTAEAAGFRRPIIRDVTLAIAQRETHCIALKVGQVAEEVHRLRPSRSVIEPDTASLGQLIERRTIQDLP